MLKKTLSSAVTSAIAICAALGVSSAARADTTLTFV